MMSFNPQKYLVHIGLIL